MEETLLSTQNDRVPSASFWRDAWRGPGFISLALALVTLAVFWSVRGHDFINYDDPYYITDNPHVRGGLEWHNVVWAFTNLESGFWHPLTWLSIMLDCQLFGLRAGGHHLTSLLLHVANTVLLFVVVRRMTAATWRSAFVAGLFALHPLHIESVAWAAERKDVLSTFFGLLTLMAYAAYVQQAEGKRQKAKGYYALALFFFVCAVMSKTMVVTWPLILLLLDWWPLRRRPSSTLDPQPLWKRFFLLEKVPFLAISLLATVLTLHGQSGVGAIATTSQLPIQSRIANSVLSFWCYPVQMLWPRELAVFYPYPAGFSYLLVVVGAIFLLIVSALVVVAFRRAPYLAAGWFWYLVTLLPVIGLIQVGAHAHADRYTYVPLIGLFIMVAWGVSDLMPRFPARGIVLALAAVLSLAALGWKTRQQLQFWRESETLFRHAIRVTGNNRESSNCLGVALASKGRIEEAMRYFREAMRFDPNDAETHDNLGKGLLEQNKVDEAVAHFREAIRFDPRLASPHGNLGHALLRQNKPAEAIMEYREALRLKPDEAEIHNSLGIELAKQGNLEEAIAHFHSAIQFEPGSASPHGNLGKALMEQQKLAEAVKEYQEALRLKPDDALTHDNLGVATAMQGRIEEAISHFQDALRFDPNYASAHNNLGKALVSQHRLDEGIKEYQEALRLAPEEPLVRDNLARALAEQTRVEQAIAHYTELLRVRADDPEAHFGLGVALIRKGNPEAAAGQFAETLRLKPEHSRAQSELRKLREPGRPPSSRAGVPVY